MTDNVTLYGSTLCNVEVILSCAEVIYRGELNGLVVHRYSVPRPVRGNVPIGGGVGTHPVVLPSTLSVVSFSCVLPGGQGSNTGNVGNLCLVTVGSFALSGVTVIELPVPISSSPAGSYFVPSYLIDRLETCIERVRAITDCNIILTLYYLGDSVVFNHHVPSVPPQKVLSVAFQPLYARTV